MLTIEQTPGACYGRMQLPVPGFDRTFELEIWLADGHAAISDKTVDILNDLVTLSPKARGDITKLLYENAMRAREEAAFGDPNPPPEIDKPGLFSSLFHRRKTFRFVTLAGP